MKTLFFMFELIFQDQGGLRIGQIRSRTMIKTDDKRHGKFVINLYRYLSIIYLAI